MSGHMAGVCAASYPSDIRSLCLVCPPGLQWSTDNQFVQRLKKLWDSAAVQKVPVCTGRDERDAAALPLGQVPQQICPGLVVRVPRNGFYRKLFLEIVSEKSRCSQPQNMDKMKVPTQIIWGNKTEC